MSIQDSTTGSAENDLWTVQKLIHWTTSHFLSKKIESARLDAEILLSHAMGCRRLDLYLNFEKPLGGGELKKFRELIVRRAAREPVAYIIEEQEFYGRKFNVGQGVLIPRPETELLIDEVLGWRKNSDCTFPRILDAGCGSGCIAITLAKEIPDSEVLALDSSEFAELFTAKNTIKHEVQERCRFVRGDVLSFESESRFDVIVTNPPYVSLKEKENLQPEVKNYEPDIALFGGERGTELLTAWLPKLVTLLNPHGFLAIEMGYDQSAHFLKEFEKTGLLKDVQVREDISGHKRVIKARKA